MEGRRGRRRREWEEGLKVWIGTGEKEAGIMAADIEQYQGVIW